MAERRHLHPKDVAGKEAVWAGKKGERRARRAKRERKRYLEAQLEDPNLTVDEDSADWDDIWLTTEESSAPGSISDEEYFKFKFKCSLNLLFESSFVCNIKFVLVL
jgi:hypothetical protein